VPSAGRVPPARAADLSGLARTYIEVGELDIFRDKDVEYARRLAAAPSNATCTRAVRTGSTQSAQKAASYGVHAPTACASFAA
jgi:acetyl esterase/lipase